MLNNTVIVIKDDNHFKLAQQRLFTLGLKWHSGSTTTRHWAGVKALIVEGGTFGWSNRDFTTMGRRTTGYKVLHNFGLLPPENL